MTTESERTERTERAADLIAEIEAKRHGQVILFICALILAILGGLLIAYRRDMFEVFGCCGTPDSSELARYVISGLVLVLAGGSILTTLFLNGFRIRPQEFTVGGNARPEALTRSLIEVVSSIEEIGAKILEHKNISPKDEEVISKHVELAVGKGLTAALADRIERKYGKSFALSQASDLYSRIFDESLSKLGHASSQQGSRANANLGWGIFISVLGLIILASLIFFTKPSEMPSVDKYFFYSSRLVLFFTVEGVAIFFLRQYRSSLNEQSKTDAIIAQIEISKLCYLTGMKIGDEELVRSSLKSSIDCLGSSDKGLPEISPRSTLDALEGLSKSLRQGS